MWFIAVALLLKSGPVIYNLPRIYVGQNECREAVEKFKAGWHTTPGTQAAYKCFRVWRI